MRSTALRSLLCAAAAVIMSAPLAEGQAVVQASSCSYARCALRLEADPNVPNLSRLVQGIDARPVATFGLLVPTIPLFVSTTDSIRLPYETFRRHDAAFRVLIGVSLAATLASGAMLGSHGPSHGPSFAATLGVDVGLITAAFVEGSRAASALQTAIDRYNARLPDR